MIVLYAAWLKILTEIVGDSTIEDTPLAIRTANTIYNTADLIRLFINLDVKGMLYNEGENLVVKSMLDSFYAPSDPLSADSKDSLFISKRLALKRLGNNISYETLKEHAFVQTFLHSSMSKIKRPTFSTNFRIKFKNWKQLS